MRFVLGTALIVVGLAGCSRAAESERVGQAKDTVITPRQTQDTTIITSDTSVKVDTTVKKGQEAVPTDTTRETR
ncbi:MAG TPA: hypothetical protein VHL81_07375 [Gemmatimonadales bacterium]|jgi:hypothetical protein|nr:hypothetical protein [Gemmatimonadales bacterium]